MNTKLIWFFLFDSTRSAMLIINKMRLFHSLNTIILSTELSSPKVTFGATISIDVFTFKYKLYKKVYPSCNLWSVKLIQTSLSNF